MRDSISKKEFCLSLLFNGINTITWISYTTYYTAKKIELGKLIYLTMITWNFNSIYLLLCLICDTSYFFKSTKLEPLNNFLRNKFCNVINTMSFEVTVLYWILLFMGGMRKLTGFWDFLSTFYFHFLISILVILDIFNANHRRHKFTYITLSFCYVYLVCYFIIASISTWGFNKPPYPFLNEIKIYMVVVYAIAFCIVLALCYLFLVSLYTIKYKYILKKEGDEGEANTEEKLDKKILSSSQENEKSECV